MAEAGKERKKPVPAASGTRMWRLWMVTDDIIARSGAVT